MRGDGWLLMVLSVLGGFLPVMTMRNAVGRVVGGCAALVASGVFVSAMIDAAAPGAGLGGLAVGFVAAAAWLVLILLFLLGVCAGILRFFRWVAHRNPRLASLLLAVAALLAAAVLAMPKSRNALLELGRGLWWGARMFLVPLWPLWLVALLIGVLVSMALVRRRSMSAPDGAASPLAAPPTNRVRAGGDGTHSA